MKRKLVLALKIAGALLLALGAAYAAFMIAGALALSSARAELEKAGRPMSASQIIPPAISNLENAAPLYEAAFKLIDSAPLKEGSLEKASKPFEKKEDFVKLNADKAKLEELGAVLENPLLKESLSLIRRGNERGSCRFDVKYKDGPAAAMPHVQFFRKAVNMLCVEAALKAGKGDMDSAWGYAIEALEFANALQNEPFLISQLVRAAAFDAVATEIGELLKEGAPDEKRCAELLKALKPFRDSSKELQSSVDAERLLLGDYVFKAGGFEAGAAAISLLPSFRFDYAFYLRAMNAFSKDLASPYSNSEAVKLESKVPRLYFLSSMLLPALSSFKERLFAMNAKASTLAAAAKILDRKRVKGALPEKLEDLELPDLGDPFTGKALLYKRDGSGFAVYSAGANLIDDGGDFKSGAAGKDLDVGWRFDFVKAKP